MMREMRVFVYDGETRADHRRKWSTILPDPTSLTWNGSDLVGGATPTAGDVVICHRVGDAILKKLSELEQSGAYVIIIASNSSPLVPAPGNRYWRATGVGSPVDPHFRACFDRFVAELRGSQKLDFTLLEPQLPEHVLACYVCALGGVPPRDDWKSGFENEVGYWRYGKGRDGKDTELRWNDRADLAKLRAFLAATQGLVNQPAPVPLGEVTSEGR